MPPQRCSGSRTSYAGRLSLTSELDDIEPRRAKVSRAVRMSGDTDRADAGLGIRAIDCRFRSVTDGANVFLYRVAVKIEGDS